MAATYGNSKPYLVIKWLLLENDCISKCQSKSQQTEGFISTDNPSSSKCQIGSWSMAHSSTHGARGFGWAVVYRAPPSTGLVPVCRTEVDTILLSKPPRVHNLHLEVFRIRGPYMVASRGFSRGPMIYRNILLFFDHNYITSLSRINYRLTFTQKEFSVLIFEKFRAILKRFFNFFDRLV